MRKLHLLLFTLLFIPAFANAFTVNPTLVELKPSGKDSTASLVIENKEDKPLNISAFMKVRAYDEAGKELRSDFDVKKNFLIMPANLVIKPKGAATIKIVYVGPKKFPTEKAYRLIIANVDPQPFKKFKGEGVSAAVKMLVSYAAAVYVTPESAKPDIVLEKIQSAGKPAIQVSNKGNQRISFNKQKVKVTAKNLKEPEQFEIAEFPSLIAPILPGNKRVVVLPKGSKADPATATLNFKGE